MDKQLKVLIVDDDKRMVKTLVDIFRVKGLTAVGAASGAIALETIRSGKFDCVLTDIRMPDMNGVELAKKVHGITPALPVVLMSAFSDATLIEEGLTDGAVAALSKPLDINLILNLFASLTKETSIVIVDDDINFSKTLADILNVRNFKVVVVPDPHDALEYIDTAIQVVLLDMKLNAISGYDVLLQIRKKYPNLPVILVTGHRKEMAAVIDSALDLRAFTCLYKPFAIEELLNTLEQITRQGLKKMLG
ncbi:MAG: response regulator [Candidatus Neomarinimicrobiota bacterium]